MKKLFLVIILLTIITAGYAQVDYSNVTENVPEITVGDTPEPILWVSTDSETIAKMAVWFIKARKTSTILLNFAEFTIEYKNSIYKVYEHDTRDDADVLAEEPLYESTRVADIRIFMIDYLQSIMDNL